MPLESHAPPREEASQSGGQVQRKEAAGESEVYVHPNSPSAPHFHILGLTPDASSADIRRAYYNLCKKLHPDKCSADARSLEELQKIQDAYRLLSDEVQRLVWELKSDTCDIRHRERKLEKLQELQHLRTSRDKLNMQIEYAEKLQREKNLDGVVILSALYGNLRLRPSLLHEHFAGVIEEQHLEGPFVDVTIPLQCQIDDSRFVFAGGASSSFEQLAGFHNPAPLMNAGDVALYVLYRFRGRLHEVTVSDSSKLALPLKSHLCLRGMPRGPYAASNAVTANEKECSSRRQCGNRRNLLCTFLGAGLACAAVCLLYSPRQRLSEVLQQLQQQQQRQVAAAAAAVSSLAAAASRFLSSNRFLMLKSNRSSSGNGS